MRPYGLSKRERTCGAGWSDWFKGSRAREKRQERPVIFVSHSFCPTTCWSDEDGHNGRRGLVMISEFHSTFDCGCLACDLNESAEWNNPDEWEDWYKYQVMKDEG